MPSLTTQLLHYQTQKTLRYMNNRNHLKKVNRTVDGLKEREDPSLNILELMAK